MEKIRRFFQQHRQAAVLILFVALSFGLMGIQTGTVRNASSELGYSVLSTMQLGFAKVGNVISDSLGSIRELRKVRSEYEELQERINQYRNIERNVVDLKEENERLRDLLGFSRKLEYTHVAARIIGKKPGDVFQGIKINRGTRDGVERNDSVVSYTEGFKALVGKIVELGPNTAIVMPIVDSASYVAARMRDSRYEGLVQGSGTNIDRLVMRHVKKRAKGAIRYGNLVITSGNNSLYPPDIYIGRVEAVEAPEWEPSLTITVTPIADFARLEYVFVLTGTKGERK